MIKTVYIIILNWHGWRDTIECIHSLQHLDYMDYKVIVVDNDSADESVERIAEAFPDIKVLSNSQNLGFAGGNNPGIQYALAHRADYVWLLNNDTTVSPDALSQMVDVAEQNPRVGAVGAVILDHEPPHRIQAWGGGRIRFWTGRSLHLTAPGTLEYITGASLLLRRETVRQIGLLDEHFFMYWEDADLGLRIKAGGWMLAVAEHARIYHKESVTLGKKSVGMDIYFNRSAVRFFRKHARYSLVPVVVGVGGRLLKRLLQGDWRRALAVLRGALSRTRGPLGG